jgi:LacI family transcriptional regulator
VSPGVPVVYALTPSSDPGDCSIVVDDAAAGRVAGEHLIRLGRRRIGHITGSAWFDPARKRAAGLAEALGAAGLEVAGDPLYGDWTEAWGRQATHILLRSCPDVDAIYCGSDVLARGVGDSLRELGCRVPEDVALIGTDNWEFIAGGARPPLTSVDLGLSTVGRLAARRLLEAIGGNSHAGKEYVPCRLVVRGSTDDLPPASSGSAS